MCGEKGSSECFSSHVLGEIHAVPFLVSAGFFSAPIHNACARRQNIRQPQPAHGRDATASVPGANGAL
jgi:hypothetical protein